jgi:hypothetical protein
MFEPIFLMRLFLLLFLLSLASTALAVDFNANWAYREFGGDRVETRRDFREHYSLGLGPSLTYQPSHALSFSAGLGYTKKESNSGQGYVGTETVTPTARGTLVNDIFVLGLSGDAAKNRPDSGNGSSRYSWDTFLASAWDIPSFPRLNFNYSEQNENSEKSGFFSEPDQTQKNFGAGLNWDLGLADISYHYSNSEAEDPDNASRILADSHFVRFETGGSFWDRRVSFNLAQQYQTGSQEIPLDTPEAEGLPPVEFPLAGSVATAVNNPLSVPVPLPGELLTIGLDANPELSNSDLEQIGLTVNPGERVYLSARFESTQRVEFVRLTFDPISVVEEIVGLQWNLYSFDRALGAWDLVAENLPVFDVSNNPENPGLKQIRIDIGRDEQEFMLVAIHPDTASESLRVTELETFDLRERGSQTSSSRYLTNFGLRYRISRTLSSSVNFTLDRSENDIGDGARVDDKRSVSGSLRWAPVNFLTTTLGVSEYRDQPQDEAELISHNYSLIVSTIPLPRMNLSLGVQLSDRFSDSQKLLSTLRYSLNATAPIYPDLSAALNFSYSESDRLVTNPDLPDSPEVFAQENSFSSRLTLNAKLYEKLTGDMTVNYSQSESETGSSDSGIIDIGLRSRLSEYLSLRAAYSTEFIQRESSDSLSLNANMRVLDTPKARLNLSATHTQGDTVTDNLAFNWNWYLSKNLTLQGSGSYRMADTNSYNYRAALSLNL